MLNIFFSGSSEGKAHFRRKELGIDGEDCTSLDLFLHAGDISIPMSVSVRSKVYDVVYDGYSSIESDEIRLLKRKLKKENSVCIWYSIKDTDEYLGMLAVLEYLNGKGKTIYLCEYSDMVDVLYYLDDKEITAPPERKILAMNKYQRFMNEWAEIKKVNAELRIIRNGKIENMPADYIDQRIFEIVGDGEVTVYSIIQPILCDDLPRMLAFIKYRIQTLIDCGQLEVVKQGMVQQCVYGRMKEFMKTIVRRKNN